MIHDKSPYEKELLSRENLVGGGRGACNGVLAESKTKKIILKSDECNSQGTSRTLEVKLSAGT